MPRSPIFLLGAVVLAVGVGAGVAAVILRTDSAQPATGTRVPTPTTDLTAAPDPQLGRRLYVRCQACHGIDGSGIAGNYPPLIKSSLLTADDSTAAIRLLLIGVLRSEHWNGYMPSFADQFDDRELAAVVTYARRQWGEQAKEVTAAEVAAVRQVKP